MVLISLAVAFLIVAGHGAVTTSQKRSMLYTKTDEIEHAATWSRHAYATGEVVEGEEIMVEMNKQLFHCKVHKGEEHSLAVDVPGIGERLLSRKSVRFNADLPIRASKRRSLREPYEGPRRDEPF